MATESLEKSTENLGKSIGEIFDAKNRYIIPLYQRNYAWGEVQIEALIQDIYEAYNMSKTGNYYIGSLVVLKRRNGDYEVIDGQQRLTTLSLLTKLLGITETPVLTYESRPEVELFFKEFYELDINANTLETDLKTKITSSPQTFYLREAINVIKDAKINKDGDDKTSVGIEEWSGEIKEYLEKNVILVRVEIPEDTDVASYFEIMNNRGEQLQKHEILKARLMNALEPKYHAEFDLIWTACSNIDTPIQQCFGSEDRKKYFGENYDTFTFDKLSGASPNDASSDSQQPTSINEILAAEIKEIENDKKGDNAEKDRDKISSIIDFPNFLMHVLKLYAKKKTAENVDEEFRLNEKFLLSCAEKLFGLEPDENKVNKFIALLFKCRTLFDRYVIKVKGVEDNEEFSWVLNKPRKYTYNDKNSVKYDINTYEDESLQSQVIMAQSMLQVTFRQRIYKNWLQVLLEYLSNETCELQNIQAEDILRCLHDYMKDHYKGLGIEFDKEIKMPKKDNNEKYNGPHRGVNTPHFLLNFIDYLYWVKQVVHPEQLSHKIKDFKFRYWNSVEHHLARRKAEEKGLTDIVDCLGNLFMISKNANSRLSDRDVKEKVEMSKDANMGANRQIIYNKTKDNGYNWGEDEIKNHYEELMELLGEKDKLLEIQNISYKSLILDQ